MKRAVLSLFLLVFVCAPVQAAPTQLNMDNFASIPVLHEGRVKPLDSFARLYLKKFSGRESMPVFALQDAEIPDMSASAWLAQVFFDPSAAVARPVFYIGNPNLKPLLGMPETRDYFTLPELLKGLDLNNDQINILLEADYETLTETQKQLIGLKIHSLEFMELMRSFSMILPLNIKIPDRYQQYFPGIPDRINFLQISHLQDHILSDIHTLVREKGENPQHYSDEEEKLALFAYNLDQLTAGGRDNNLVKIFQSGRDGQWVSPWMAFDQTGHTNIRETFDLWADLAAAYQDRDNERWTATIKKIQQKSEASEFHPRLEIFYNKTRPFHLALMLYGLSLLLALAGSVRHISFLPALMTGSAAAALAVQAFGLLSRIIILDRPPVGTLYESVLFVSLICAGTGFGLHIAKKIPYSLPAGLGAGAVLLLIAPYMQQGNENMEMLAAVLNTNFWLTTHVLVITAGYGICIVTACLAHVYLALKAFKPDIQDLMTLHLNIWRFSLSALLFVTVGTILGGIWADQSWGRFWGWDPKENGALLIILWLIWIHHGYRSGHLDNLSLAAGIAFLNVVVALSWFGVNLLNVGLHSYGFTSGMAAGLTVFCVLQSLLAGFLWFLGARKKGGNHAT